MAEMNGANGTNEQNVNTQGGANAVSPVDFSQMMTQYKNWIDTTNTFGAPTQNDKTTWIDNFYDTIVSGKVRTTCTDDMKKQLSDYWSVAEIMAKRANRTTSNIGGAKFIEHIARLSYVIQDMANSGAANASKMAKTALSDIIDDFTVMENAHQTEIKEIIREASNNNVVNGGYAGDAWKDATNVTSGAQAEENSGIKDDVNVDVVENIPDAEYEAELMDRYYRTKAKFGSRKPIYRHLRHAEVAVRNNIKPVCFYGDVGVGKTHICSYLALQVADVGCIQSINVTGMETSEPLTARYIMKGMTSVKVLGAAFKFLMYMEQRPEKKGVLILEEISRCNTQDVLGLIIDAANTPGVPVEVPEFQMKFTWPTNVTLMMNYNHRGAGVDEYGKIPSSLMRRMEDMYVDNAGVYRAAKAMVRCKDEYRKYIINAMDNIRVFNIYAEKLNPEATVPLSFFLEQEFDTAVKCVTLMKNGVMRYIKQYFPIMEISYSGLRASSAEKFYDSEKYKEILHEIPEGHKKTEYELFVTALENIEICVRELENLEDAELKELGYGEEWDSSYDSVEIPQNYIGSGYIDDSINGAQSVTQGGLLGQGRRRRNGGGM